MQQSAHVRMKTRVPEYVRPCRTGKQWQMFWRMVVSSFWGSSTLSSWTVYTRTGNIALHVGSFRRVLVFGRSVEIEWWSFVLEFADCLWRLERTFRVFSCARVSVEHFIIDRYPHLGKTHRFKSGDKGLMNKTSASRPLLQADDRQELVHWCVVACSAEQMVGVTGATTFAIQAAWCTDEVKRKNGTSGKHRVKVFNESNNEVRRSGGGGINLWQIVTVIRACSAVASVI